MAQSRKLSVGSIIGLGALILSAAAVVLMLVTFAFGGVRGTEFNPQTFERRMFGFYEIPLLRLQVTPLWRAETNGDVEQLVISQKYVAPEANAPETWHLISLVRRNYKQPPTDVQILVRYLDAKDADGDSYWTQWSIAHPEMAALLWPEVARLARLESYVMLPPLFELAHNAESVKAFQLALKQLQTSQLQAAAERMEHRSAKVEDEQLRTELQERGQMLATAAAAAADELSKEPQPAAKAKPMAEADPAKEAKAEKDADAGGN
jgi:hypothetical protein